MFDIVSTPIDGALLTKEFTDSSAGAIVSFEGRVRNHHNNRSVKHLEYHVYRELAIKEGQRVVAEAMEKFPVIAIKSFHREGQLAIGEIAIWIGVLSAHRAEAYAACQYIIDTVKKRLPIWKKEFYTDGAVEWVGCSHPGHTEIDEDDYYSRQLIQPDVGIAGQDRFRQARIAVVGAGGLGSPALTNLVSAGVGQIDIFDHDKVDVTNLHRQTLYTVDDIGHSKAEMAKKRLELINPFVKITSWPHKVSSEQPLESLQSYDVVLDCTDNLETKYHLNRVCHQAGIPLIIAAVHHWQAILHSFFVDSDSGCFNCLSDATPSDDCVSGCTTAGIVGVVPNIVGALQANEAIQLLLGNKPRSATHGIILDLKNLSQQAMLRTKRDNCSVCQTEPTGKVTFEKKMSETATIDSSCEISWANYANTENRFVMIDIRLESERSADEIFSKNWTCIDASDISRLKYLPQDEDYLLVCERGQTSTILANRLRRAGLTNFYSLTGGVLELGKISSQSNSDTAPINRMLNR